MKMISILRVPIIFIAAFFITNCTSDDQSKELTKSKDPALNQSAVFVNYTIQKLLRRNANQSAQSIIDYMTSTIGTAELIPPNPETEPDLAASYKGPMPGKGVFVQQEGELNEFFKKHIILSAENEKMIKLTAYVEEEEEPIHTWRITIKD